MANFFIVLLSILRLRLLVQAQADLPTGDESTQQFLYYVSSAALSANDSCESAQVNLSSSLPNGLNNLQFQALYEHLSYASNSDYILVGARNLALNISIYPRFGVSNTIVWSSRSSENDCKQLIRTFVPTSQSNDWLICEATKLQVCRSYSNELVMRGEYYMDAVSRLSNDGRAAAHYSAATDRLFFVGVIEEFYAQYDIAPASDIKFEGRIAAIDYVIQESNVHIPFFNKPAFNFQSLQESDDQMYVFFEEYARETSYNYESRRLERRVARVAQNCKRDPGYFPDRREVGPLQTTFRKLRLSCRIGSNVYESGVEYDNFAGNSRFGKLTMEDGITEKEVFYAAFTYSNEYVRRSAVCAYDVAALRYLFAHHHEHYEFEGGVWWKPLKTVMADVAANWSVCGYQSSETIDFTRKYPLLTAVLNPIQWKALYVTDSADFGYVTTINVDWQVRAADNNVYNVLYLGTESGKVMKVAVDSQVAHSVLKIDSSNVEPILSLHLAGASHAERVVAVSNSSISSSSVSHCGMYATCELCISARDVYCAWIENLCMRSSIGLADVRLGNTSSCPQIQTQPQTSESSASTTSESFTLADTISTNTEPETETVPFLLEDSTALLQSGTPTASDLRSKLIITVPILVAAAITALFIGLLIGYVCGVRTGFRPLKTLADSVSVPFTRERYSPASQSLLERWKQRIFGCNTSTKRCDSQIEETQTTMNIEFNAQKLNNLSSTPVEANLYSTSSKPVINIYESLYENGRDDSQHVERDEDEVDHYADVIQSNCHASIAMIEEMDETETNLQSDSLYDKIVNQTNSSNIENCASPDCLNDCTLHVPAGPPSKRPTFSTKLKGLLDRFNGQMSGDTSSNGATSSSNSSVL